MHAGLKAYTFLLPCMYKYIFLEYLEALTREGGRGRPRYVCNWWMYEYKSGLLIPRESVNIGYILIFAKQITDSEKGRVFSKR